jgi:hypothetical protein
MQQIYFIFGLLYTNPSPHLSFIFSIFIGFFLIKGFSLVEENELMSDEEIKIRSKIASDVYVTLIWYFISHFFTILVAKYSD